MQCGIGDSNSVRPSVRPFVSVCLSNTRIMTKRKQLAKKFNYD